MKKARGLRNNNPLNIRLSKTKWLGQITPPPFGEGRGEASFCQFESMEYGLRAALKLLRTYYTKHGCRTIRQIISRWAPAFENHTEAYIQSVARQTGLAPDLQLPPMKEETRHVWCSIVLAMASVECGLSALQREALVPALNKAWVIVPVSP